MDESFFFSKRFQSQAEGHKFIGTGQVRLQQGVCVRGDLMKRKQEYYYYKPGEPVSNVCEPAWPGGKAALGWKAEGRRFDSQLRLTFLFTNGG